MNTLVYSIGTLIGSALFALMLFSPGNAETGKVRYRLRNRNRTGLMAIFAVFMLGSLASLIAGPEGLTPERGVEIAFWISLIFFMIYMQADDLYITESGVGFADLFGKIRNRFYPWKMVRGSTLTEKKAVFLVHDGTKERRVQLSIRKLDEKTLKDIEKSIQKSTASYSKVKGRS